MSKWEVGLKTFFTSIGTFWSVLVGVMGWAFPTLIIVMVVDFATGCLASMYGKNAEGLSSKIGLKGFFKKVYVLLLIGVVFLVEKVVFGTQHLGHGVTVAYLIIEVISITENGGRLGVNLGPVQNIIAVLKEKGNGKGESK
jgi:toxin secretion/phage lysis holin